MPEGRLLVERRLAMKVILSENETLVNRDQILPKYHREKVSNPRFFSTKW